MVVWMVLLICEAAERLKNTFFLQNSVRMLEQD